MNRTHRSTLSFALVLGLAGCGGSSSGTVADAYANSVCDQVLRCDQGSGAAVREVVQSEAQCEQIVLALFGENSGYFPYLEDGTIRVNQSALSACKSLMRANPCVDPDEFGICQQIYEGTVSDGGGCVLDGQCRSGACTAVGNQCGTCAASVAVGQTCDIALQNCIQQSEGSVSCETGVSGTTCVFHADAFLTVGVGSACGNQNGVEQYCDADLYCDGTGHCAARVAVGAICSPSLDQCAYGTLCGFNGQDYRCVTVVPVTTIGGACQYLTNGAYGVCDLGRGLFCDPNTTNTAGDPTCVALAGNGVENSQCWRNSDCNSGLACVNIDFNNSEPGTCETTHKINGSACDADVECDSQYCAYSNSAAAYLCQAKVDCP